MCAVIGSSWWLWYGVVLQIGGVLLIAQDVFRHGRPRVRRMRAIQLALTVRSTPLVMRRRLRSVWRRFHDTPQVIQLTAHGAATSGGSARLTISREGDTLSILELRQRVEDLEAEHRQTNAVVAAHERRLDDLRAAQDDLVTGGVFVQAHSVALVVVGSVIATASSSLSGAGWALTGLVVLAPWLLWFLVSPAGSKRARVPSGCGGR